MDAKSGHGRFGAGLPLPVQRALRKLGRDNWAYKLEAYDAIPHNAALMAERASISRTTLNKVENGHPGVSFGNYATVLFVLGLSDRIGDLADVDELPDRGGYRIGDAHAGRRRRDDR